MEKLKERILDICYENKLSHLGSYFSSVEIIDEIYSKMKNDDIFILSSGHCAVALYAVIEKYKGIDANELFLKHGDIPTEMRRITFSAQLVVSGWVFLSLLAGQWQIQAEMYIA